MKITFTLPPLSEALIAGRGSRRRQIEEKLCKDEIEKQWAEMGKPEFDAIRVTMVFSFADHWEGDPTASLATGGKLLGDAINGLLIPGVGPARLPAWYFRFEISDVAGVTVIIEDAGPCRNSDRSACNLYEECNAPLCPLDRSHFTGIWYPGEETCRSRIHGNLPWVQAQRKLIKVEAAGYFTVAMLNHLTVIRKGISGLDPDTQEHRQLRSWFEKRVEKTEADPEEKAARSRHLEKYAFKKRGSRKS